MRYLAVFLFSVAALGSQIVWTRIFSFSIWYHFAFLVISVSMLGFTSGGLLLNLRPSVLQRPRDAFLCGAATCFALASALALLLVVNLPFDGGILESTGNLLLFGALILLVCFEFFFAGLFISFVISTDPERVSRIYFANMTGSGVGCALSVAFLEYMIPPAALLAFALIAGVAAVLLVRRAKMRANRGAALTALASIAVIAVGYVLALDPLAEPFYLRSTKSFPALKKNEILSRTSNSLSVLDFFQRERLTGLWGFSYGRYQQEHDNRPLPRRVGYCIDGWALTFAFGADGEITEEPIFDYLPATIAYHVRRPRQVLVIGAGGGIDVICGLRNGAKEITAVEINPAILEAGTTSLAKFNQGIYKRPGVTPVVAEGRSYLTAAGDRRWDLIQLSGVDTLAASQAGAFTLAENYLYTLEAFETYLEHLKPQGVLTLTRWIFDPPRQSLRVINLADAALRRKGIKETSKHMILISGRARSYSVFLVSLSPFTNEEVQRVLKRCEQVDFVPLALPHVTIERGVPTTFQSLVRNRDKASFIESYPFDISVPTDDQPFFMEHSRWSNAWKYSDYIFDRSNGQLLLLVTTLIVAFFALLFIIVPTRFIRRRSSERRRRLPVLLFFSCLGLAYILVEMVLVQKLTLYLGNPSYALAVVLCAMLVFSGIGAMLSGRLRDSPGKGLVGICIAVAVVLLGYRLLLDPVLHGTLQLPLAARVAVVLGLLSLPALLMGIPFPLAIAALGKTRQEMVVGGWVVNGYFSVLASCLAMVVSISFGFHVVLMVGAAIYVVAALSRPIRSTS